jgi:hypothetical protein
MHTGPEGYYDIYQEIKKKALMKKTEGAYSVVIFVSIDTDAVCGARILTVR